MVVKVRIILEAPFPMAFPVSFPLGKVVNLGLSRARTREPAWGRAVPPSLFSRYDTVIVVFSWRPR